MRFSKKHLIVLAIILGIVIVVCATSAHNVSAAKTHKTTVKIHNFKPGVLWAPKAKIFKNRDAIAGYVEYSGNMQFDKGTGITLWYVGTGYNGDMEPHHTKLVKVKFFFKNNKGKIKTKTVKGTGAHISTKLIKGYTPYKAKVWYTNF